MPAKAKTGAAREAMLAERRRRHKRAVGAKAAARRRLGLCTACPHPPRPLEAGSTWFCPACLQKQRERYHRNKAPGRPNPLPPRPVQCVETGEVFPSVSSAARAAGVTPAAVSNVLTGRRKGCGGRRWEYAERR